MTITVDDLTLPSRSEFTRNAPIRGNPELRQFNKFVNSAYARDKQILFGYCYKGVTAADTFLPADTGAVTQTNTRTDSRDLFEFHAIWDGARPDFDDQYRIMLEVFGRDVQVTAEFITAGLTLSATCGSTYDFVRAVGQLDLAASLPDVIRFEAQTDGDEDGNEDLIAWALTSQHLTDTMIP